MTETVATRLSPTDHEILEVLAGRWSPRAFTGDPVDGAALDSMLEAARWAPSAGNTQPWRFLVASQGSPAFDKVLASMADSNQEWAVRAGALIVALLEDVGTGHLGLYDLGQAIAHLSVQAHADGLHVHQMAGFTPENLAESFELPASITPTTIIAVGHLAGPDVLSERNRGREVAERVRKSLAELVLVRD